MSTLQLFGLQHSVYTRIAMLACEEKNIEYTLTEIDVFSQEETLDTYLNINPFGKIPALRHNQFTLYETSAIVRYIDEAFDGPSLQPIDPIEHAKMNQIISLLDAYAYPSMIWPVFVERVSVPIEGGVADEKKIAEVLPKIRLCLRALDSLMANRHYMVGSVISLADIYAAPILLYFNETTEGKELIGEINHIDLWLQAIRKRSSVLSTVSKYGV